jgi:hypothetical protein
VTQVNGGGRGEIAAWRRWYGGSTLIEDARPAGGRRALTALLALTAIVLLPSSAAATGPLYDPARGCVNGAPTTPYTSTVRTGAAYETLGTAATIAAATRLRDELERTDVFGTWQALFASSGRTVVPPAGGGSVYEIFVVPDIELTGAFGVQLPYCSQPRTTAVVIPASGVDSPDGLATAAHELFHAFQSGAAGGAIWPGWWTEATAEWGNKLLFDQPLTPDNRDDAFLRRPQVPLDRFTGTGPDRLHQYGAYRFVERLSRRMGSRAFWDLLVDTFEETGHINSLEHPGSPPNQTAILRRALDDHGRQLDEELGRFWAAHLEDTADNGPAAEVTPLPVETGSDRQNFRVSSLAAKLLSFPLGSGVKKVHVEVDRVEGNEHLWVRAGGLDERRSYDQTFCVNTGRNADLPRWISDFALAYTNGTGSPASLRVSVEGLTNRQGCGRDCPERIQPGRTASCPVDPGGGPPCTPRFGQYVTQDPAEPFVTHYPYVYTDVLCGHRGEFVNAFGGTVQCHSLHGDFTVKLGEDLSGGHRVTTDEYLHGQTAHFSYAFGTPPYRTTVEAEVNFAPDTATGTVRAIQGGTDGDCDSGVTSFTGTWYPWPDGP